MTQWSDSKAWRMDIVKNIILFFIFAILTYLVFDSLNVRRAKRQNAWEQKLTLEINVIRDFELGWRNFKENADEALRYILIEPDRDYQEQVVYDFNKSYRELMSHIKSVRFWFGDEITDLDESLDQFSEELNKIKHIEDMASSDDGIGDLKKVYLEEVQDEEQYKIALEIQMEVIQDWYINDQAETCDSLFSVILSKFKETNRIK
jgi:hypothetical protein